MIPENLFQLMLDAALGGLLWVIPLIMATSALTILIKPRLKGAAGELAVSSVLKRLGHETLNDVIIPDSHGGLTQLDHVLFTPNGLLVIETKNYAGSVFGKPREKQWTQRLGRQSIRFSNPLRQNFLHTETVKALLSNVPVHGRVVFSGTTRFPKGIPEGVSKIDTLHQDISHLLDGDSTAPQLAHAWDQFKTIA